MIRDGKQLLMLKALGGSRSVYSIEEKGTPRTGITRSGKRHFQFSLPKFVNGLEGMNDHSQESEHVVDKNLQPRVTQPRRGHFAKKSTGNNLRHTVSGLKGGPAGKSGQQHSKHNVSSTAKKSIPNSLDNVNQAGSTQRARNLSSVQSEDFRIAKGVSKRDDDTSERSQTLKETKKGKASDAGRKHAQERQNVTERVVNKRSDSSVHPSKDSLKKERVNFEVAKDLKKGKHNVGNKENHLKLKDVQITKEHPSSKASLKQKMEPTVFSSKEQTAISKQLKVTSTASSGSSRERTITDGNEIEVTTNIRPDVSNSTPDSAPSVEVTRLSDDQKLITRSSKYIEKFTSMTENQSPKKVAMTTGLKRQRASTPTPESLVEKSVLGRLSRKRHRSASPVVPALSSEKKLERKVANQPVKTSKESIKLDSKNFEKVRNACKNAISQRKEKTSLEKGASDVCQAHVKHSTEVQSSVTHEATQAQRNSRQQISEDDLPPGKRKKTTSSVDLKVPLCENILTATSRSSDSEDGLTKLMKDFQSAMSSPSLTKASTQALKGNLRYISKKTSRHLGNGKSTQSVVSNLEQTDQKVAGEKASSTKTVGVSHDINKLQPEDISSDEDFETSQDPHVVSSSKVASNIPSTGDVFFSKAKQSSKLSIKIPEAKLTPSKDNFLVVDEVGFTPDESNSSQSVSSSEVGHTQSPNASNKLVEEIAASKPKSSLVQISDDVLGTFDLPENKCALPVASQEEKDAEMRQRQAAVEVKVFAKEGNPLNVSTRVKVANTQTTFTQTEDQVEKKDVAIETMSLKPDMKDQSVQFSSITNDIDPEEITPIVTAMFESECEEKERLKKALDEKIGKEEKWRNMVKDLCRQLRELRQQLEKKEPEKHARNASVNTFSETSALPVIISTQATQTEKCESPAISCTVSAKPYQESTEGHAIAIDENTGKQGTSSAVSSAANSNLHEPMKTQTVASPSSQVISEKETDLSVANGAVNLTKPVQSQSLHTAMTNGTQVTEQSSEATEVIDLTDSEDPSESTIQVKKSPVQSISPLKLVANHRGLQTSGHNSQPVLSKPNILQVNSKSLAIDQPQANIRPVVSQAGIPQVPSLRSLQPEKTMPAIIRTSLPSVQNMQRSMPHRQMQNQFPVTSVNRTSAAPVITQLVATQSKQSVQPPPLQPAPTIAASVYSKPQTSHMPLLSSTLGILMRTQPQQRQDLVLSRVSQQAVQHHGLTPLQQQQVKNSVLIEEFKRGMLQPGLSTYQGSASIMLPGGSHQVTALPLRLPQAHPQVQSTLQEKKGTMLDDKRDGLSRQFQQTYQLSNAQKQVGKAPQLKSGLNEMEGSEKVQMQTFRNFKVSAPSEMVSQAHRYQAPPAHSSAPVTVQPVNHINTSTVRTQSTNILQQREVVNGVKQFVPLTSLSSQPRKGVQVITGRTWFPNSRQGDAAGQNQGTPSHQIISKGNAKHPASLPILQLSSSVAEKGPLLPSPSIRISHSPEGVVLSWNITTTQDHPTVKKYFLYAYQVLNTPPSTSHWKRIGEVGALPPPMACTLNQFQPGSTYFLAICAVDVYDRPGYFSKTEEVVIPRS
ncbi:uncharacterized protein [Apostichopus japonicus]